MDIKKDLSHDPESKSFRSITKRKNGTIRVQTFNQDPSMTDPQWGQESDINYIMKKFEKTGQLTHLSKNQGVYADVSEIPDLLNAAIIVRESQLKFDALPSSVREKFNNNPQDMINFLQDPKNLEEATQLGLLHKLPAKNDELNDEKSAGTKPKSKPTEPPSKLPEPE